AAPTHPASHSFPTRRSSDLACIGDQAVEHPAGALGDLGGDAVDLLRIREVAGDVPLAQVDAQDSVARGLEELGGGLPDARGGSRDRKSTRLNSSHVSISYAV